MVDITSRARIIPLVIDGICGPLLIRYIEMAQINEAKMRASNDAKGESPMPSP